MSNTSIKETPVVDSKIKEPSKFCVVVYNDNVTTVEFVIEMLTKIFRHDAATAEELTLKIHEEGSAIVGTYTYEIAEQKALDGTTLARNKGFPLVLKIVAE